MTKSSAIIGSSWIQSAIKDAATPVFPVLPAKFRPYILATGLFLATSAVTWASNGALLRYGLPWSLMALLVIVAAANIWGVRPAILVLGLSATWGMFVIPRLTYLTSNVQLPYWQSLALRTTFFLACGAASIWLAHQARISRQKADLRREVVVALQSIVTANSLAKAPGFEVASAYKPARREEEVGGDFYDFFPCGDGKYAILIGDVMGKGKEAAVCTALLRYSVRAFTSRDYSPSTTMRHINNLIDSQELPFQTATMFLGILDSHSGRMTFANAGHEPPMLKRMNGMEELLESTGPMLGIGIDLPYEEQAIQIALEDALLLVTDGVTEARNASGQFLRSDGTWRLFRESLENGSTKDAMSAIDSAVSDYIVNSPCDDIAMLLLRRVSDPMIESQIFDLHAAELGELRLTRHVQSPKQQIAA